MSKKKSTKAKKNISKMANDININDIDAIMEDMKKLVFEEPKVQEEEILETKEEEKIEEPQLVEKGGTKPLKTDEITEEIILNLGFEEFEDKVVVPEGEFGLNIELEPQEEIKVIFEEENKQIAEEKEEQQAKEEKPKKHKSVSQAEMFNTWMGYGYTTYV